MATEEHQRFDSFQRSQECERLPTNPGKPTHNPSFKLDFMKLNRTRTSGPEHAQKERCLSATVSGVSDQIDPKDQRSRSQNNQAGCSCHHQPSHHKQSSNCRKLPSCQEVNQPRSDIDKSDVGDTKIKSSQYNLKELKRASRRARGGQSKESCRDQATVGGATQGVCGDARQTTKRSSMRSRSDAEV